MIAQDARKIEPLASAISSGRNNLASFAQLGFFGHALMENRNGLVVDGRLTLATGTAEREAALDMIGGISGSGRVTLGADKDTTRRTLWPICALSV